MRALVEHWSAAVRGAAYGFLAIPGSITAAFAALALVLTRIDRLTSSYDRGIGFGGSASAASDLLTAIAAGVVTLAGLVFSISIITLQLVSQQFTPRALRTFLADSLNQVVAGCFVGVFAYCLLVLRTVRSDDVTDRFVPSLSVTLAIVLGVGALVLLLVFVDHMTKSIQVSTIVAEIARQTRDAVDRIYPSEYGRAVEEDPDEVVEPWLRKSSPALAFPPRTGFVQSIAEIGNGAPRGLRVRLLVAPGAFVSPERPVAQVWADDEGAVEAVRGAFRVANERDLAQDVEYGIRQIADIAIRALSPSLNDPTTACTCLEYLGEIVELLAGREFPERVRRLEEQDVVVVVARREFDDFVASALLEIARHASRDPRVLDVLLASLAGAAEAAGRAGAEDRHRVLVEDAERIVARALDEGGLDEQERAELEERVEAIRRGDRDLVARAAGEDEGGGGA